MLDFHYNTIEANFKGKYNLLYSDTDSLVYQIEHKNLHTWMKANGNEFDFSNMSDEYKDETITMSLAK